MAYNGARRRAADHHYPVRETKEELIEESPLVHHNAGQMNEICRNPCEAQVLFLVNGIYFPRHSTPGDNIALLQDLGTARIEVPLVIVTVIEFVNNVFHICNRFYASSPLGFSSQAHKPRIDSITQSAEISDDSIYLSKENLRASPWLLRECPLHRCSSTIPGGATPRLRFNSDSNHRRTGGRFVQEVHEWEERPTQASERARRTRRPQLVPQSSLYEGAKRLQ